MHLGLVACFCIILILELRLGLEVVLHLRHMLYAFKRRKILYISLVILKIFFVTAVVLLFCKTNISFTIFGVQIYLDSFFYFFASIFLVSKSLLELFEISNSRTENIKSVVPHFDQGKKLDTLVYFFILSFFESSAIAISLTDNLMIILSSIVTSIIAIYFIKLFLIRIFYKYYFLRSSMVAFSAILGLKLMLYCFGV